MADAGIHEEDVLGKAYDGRLMRRLLRYVRPYRRLVVLALALLFVEGALQLVGPFLTRQVIDVAVPTRDLALVRMSVVLLALSLAASFVCSYFETVVTARLGQSVMHDLREELFSRLQRLPIAFFDRNPVGRLVTRVTADVESLNELFTAGVVAGLGDLFTLVAIAIAMFVVDWRLALAGLAVIPLVFLTSHAFRRAVRETYREIRTRLARINAFLNERIVGMRVVQLFGRERDEARRFDRLNRDHLDAHLKSITVYALYFPAIEILTTVALAVLIVAAAQRVGLGTLTVGTVAAFLQLLRRFFQPLQDLSEKYNILQQAMAASERIFTLLDTPLAPGTTNDDGKHVVAPAQVAARRGVAVEFQDVWFAYEEPRWVLRGVSFHVDPGETLAVVGHTGAGKTTIVSLLLRFYEPQRGRILVDGTDIREIPLDRLRALVGYVQQDIFLFAGDVASNIRLGTALTDEQVAMAASRVGADRVVAKLPGGYRYELGERGASVSVGERQLLSFARAIAADPALLVLDEATSAVDSEIEARIQSALVELMRGRTTIAIAHRLSTIVGADRILVLHQGEVREEGRHESLLLRGGLYERLYRLQAGVA
ncbi:MAG TPA: ABC transporter ATP-binding protein [Gemmatimonadaceae bacterium]|nr:ABC transporter ATP-binding protein [Gemmatimonadaceae bacterium]